MKRRLYTLFVPVVFTVGYCLSINSIKAQVLDTPKDIVYLFTGDAAFDVRITDVTADKVLLKDDKGKVSGFTRSNVLMAFSQQGNFLIINELSTDLDSARRQVKAFLAAPLRSDGNDYLIIANPLSVKAARIVVDNNNIVNYKTPEGNSASINKNELLAILYRDGRHKLLKSPGEVAPLLAEVRPDLENGGKPIVKPNPDPAPPIVDSIATVAENKGNLLVLTDDEKEKYQESSLHRLDDFIVAVNTVTDRNRSNDEKDRAINDALKLFADGATIEVNSVKNPNPRPVSLKNYLNRLRVLPYRKTTVEWYEVNFVENLTPTADGLYEGTIAGEQRFTAQGANGRTVYSDVTRKNVRVRLSSYDKTIDGKASTRWHILLGNIKINVEN
ncbi:hypothetical protein [Spirosoma spitsbergense]|uniref:hypothetical protein n=1 Tax=Spirosoma spitsbergense TaxID=431554 RepID=UPI000378D8F5|nr:hypothetical protein [Spirosoma spitsbergense]